MGEPVTKPRSHSDEVFFEALNQAAAGGATAHSIAYVDSVHEQIDRAWEILTAVSKTYKNNTIGSLRGFLAEAHHAGTYNIDAARRGLTGRDASVVHSNQLESPDLRVDGPSGVCEAQLKFHVNPRDNASGLSGPGFDAMLKVVPSDQLEAVREAASQRSSRIAGHRPEQAAHLDNTARRVTDRIEKDGASSQPISTEEATAMARDAQRGDLTPERYKHTVESTITWSDVTREAAKSATVAALVSAVVSAAPHLWRTIQTGWREGRFDSEELERAFREGGAGAGHAALRGALAGGVVAACKAGRLGNAVMQFDASSIGAATAVSLSAFIDARKLWNGDMTSGEFAERCGRNVIVATASTVGAGVGQALLPIPVLGAMLGSLLGSTIGTVGFEHAETVLAALENRVAFENQLRLTESIARLAVFTKVVASRVEVLVVVHESEIAAIASAGSAWVQDSASRRAQCSRIDSNTQDVFERDARQQERIARLGGVVPSE